MSRDPIMWTLSNDVIATRMTIHPTSPWPPLAPPCGRRLWLRLIVDTGAFLSHVVDRRSCAFWCSLAGF